MSNEVIVARLEPLAAASLGTDPALWHSIELENVRVLRGQKLGTDRVQTICGIEIQPINGRYPIDFENPPEKPDCEGCLNGPSTPDLINEIEAFLKDHAKQPATI